MEEITVRRNLKYEFTMPELLNMGSELANAEQELRGIEDQKKSVNAEFSSRMTVSKERINMLTNKISARHEFVDVDCLVTYHKPEKDLKTLTRKDNGECFTEPMTVADYDLFTQWQDEANANQDSDIEQAPIVTSESDELPFIVTGRDQNGVEHDITEKIMGKKGKVRKLEPEEKPEEVEAQTEEAVSE